MIIFFFNIIIRIYYETRYEDSILNPNSNASSNIGSRNNTNWNYNDDQNFDMMGQPCYHKQKYQEDDQIKHNLLYWIIHLQFD